jgi:hypothetical protein
MMFQDRLTTGAANGVSITLGGSDWPTITPGSEVIQVQADGYPMEPMTLQQYNNIFLKTQAGRPLYWVYDGLNTVYLYPAATSNTLSIMARVPFSTFADLDTAYTMPSGYEGAFAATLAVSMQPSLAPNMSGQALQGLKQGKQAALFNIQGQAVRPAIVLANPLGRSKLGANILQGWR